MDTQLQYSMALEVARERIRDAEVRARLHWGGYREPSPERGMIGRLAGLCRAVSRTPSSRDGRCRSGVPS